MNEMQNKLAKEYNFVSLLKFSLPTIVMMVFMSLYSMVDGIFVSRLIGTNALAATNIVYPIVSVVIAAGIMLGTGGSAVVACRMGENKPHEARREFTMLLVSGVGLGLLITAAGLLSLKPLLRFLGASEAIFGLCYEYAWTLLCFTVPSILQMLFQMFFVTAGKAGIGLTFTILGGVANIVLDYVFIARFGWGIGGAALATGIGYSIPAVSGLAWFALDRTGTLFFVRPAWNGRVLLQTMANGSSEMVTNLSAAVITYLFNILMIRYLGEDGVAAITIVLYAEFFLIAIYLGFSSGIAPILSYNHGERNVARLKRLFGISVRFLLGCSLLTFAGAVLFAENVVGIFAARGTPVFAFAVHGYYLYAFSYLFKGVNIFASSMFTALSDGITSAFLSFMRTLVFIVAGMFILPRWLQIDGVWLVVPVAEVLSIVLSVYFFRWQFRTKWGREIDIRPVTEWNRREVLTLQLAGGQESFIEKNAESLAEADKDQAWRPVAIYAKGRIIGFAMYGRFGNQDKRVWLDRLMIDERYQNRGYGKKAVRALIERLKREYRSDRIYLSVYPDNDKARRLYEDLGFDRNGEYWQDEEIMMLRLES